MWAAAMNPVQSCPPTADSANHSTPHWAHFGPTAGQRALQLPFPQLADKCSIKLTQARAAHFHILSLVWTTSTGWILWTDFQRRLPQALEWRKGGAKEPHALHWVLGQSWKRLWDKLTSSSPPRTAFIHNYQQWQKINHQMLLAQSRTCLGELCSSFIPECWKTGSKSTTGFVT